MTRTKYHPVTYFTDHASATVVCEILRGRGYPDARVVAYTRGHAVQYYVSGPYYPELEIRP